METVQISVIRGVALIGAVGDTYKPNPDRRIYLATIENNILVKISPKPCPLVIFKALGAIGIDCDELDQEMKDFQKYADRFPIIFQENHYTLSPNEKLLLAKLK